MREITPQQAEYQSECTARVKKLNLSRESAPRACVVTYGCQQNESDSEKLRGMLCEMGYLASDDPKTSDVVIFNTCAVRENAELKVFGNVGALKHAKRKNPDMIIGVCGCMMQQPHISETIKSKYNHIDIVFGPHALYRLPEILERALEKNRVFEVENSDGEIVEGIPVLREPPPLAKVPIMYGCNNFCTYCIVPYVRGRERSRKSGDILKEVRGAAERGYKEVMLLGQNVNSFGNPINSDENISFPELLRMVCKIDGIERVRFMTSHPKDLSDELIYAIAEEDKICKQLHLPIQSGSDKVLRDMNRGYTAERYMERLDKVRELIPDITVTSDIIVGFPTETNEDFEDTLDIIRRARYDMVFSFIYSKRVGTPAAKTIPCLTDEEIHRNFDRLLEVQNEISKQKNDEYVGRVEEILVESESKTNPEYMCGRTSGGKIVNFKGGAELVSRLVPVKIVKAQTWSLTGELCD